MSGFWGYVLVFYLGLLVGWLIRVWFARKFRDYSGTIVVERDERNHKTVYSLVLDEYPEKLEFKKVVVFKVDVPEEGSDRE